MPAVKQAARKQPGKVGRPSLLDDPKVVEELCARIAEGRGIINVCSDKDMPDKATVYRRMANDTDFATLIARAREAQQDCEAEECVEMADRATAEDWQVVKLRIWARQWRASKLAPKRYGDKVSTEISGPDGKPIEMLAPADAVQRAAFMLAKAAKTSKGK